MTIHKVLEQFAAVTVTAYPTMIAEVAYVQLKSLTHIKLAPLIQIALFLERRVIVMVILLTLYATQATVAT